jgi:hypothetical protein
VTGARRGDDDAGIAGQPVDDELVAVVRDNVGFERVGIRETDLVVRLGGDEFCNRSNGSRWTG